MNNTQKTTIAASLAIVISFVMLFTYLNLYESGNLAAAPKQSVSSAFGDSGEKRILLLGSSYVVRLNATYIKQYISDNGLQQFQVYNVARNGEGNPSKQIAFLDDIVSAHPTAVVYGLGFRELGYKPYNDNIPKCAMVYDSSNNSVGKSFSTPSVLDAAEYLQKATHLNTDYFSNIANPKHVTVDLIRSYFDENTSSTEGNNFTLDKVDQNLIEKRGPIFDEIKSLDEINKPLDWVVRICPDDMKNELTKLDEMVSRFEKNHVKVILFIPPFSSSYLNAVGDKGIQTLLSALTKFSDERHLKLYDLHDKYVNLNIWSDAQHVAKNPKVKVYSDDLSKIILNELKSFTYLRVVDTNGNLSYKDLSNADLRNVNLSNKNMTGASLINSNLYGANVNGAILREVNLSYAYLHNVDLSGSDLTGAILVGADLTDASLKGVDLSGKDLTGTNLRGVDLSGKNLTGTILVGANLANTNLKGVDLSGKNLTGTNLSDVDLSDKDLNGTILVGANLSNATLKGVDLSDKDLTGANFKGVDLSGKDLTGTILVGANLANANLRGVDLSGKNLTGSFLHSTILYDSNLSGADLSGINLQRTVLIGANLNNAILHNTNLAGVKLTRTSFIGTDLHNAVLREVNLSGKNLTGTILSGVNLDRSDLSGMNLSGKDLAGTELVGTNLDHANLAGVNLAKKNLTGANLQGADLKGTILWKAILIDANLSGADLSGDDLHNVILKNTNFTNANLSGTNLSGNDLTGTILVGANLANANVTGVYIPNKDLSQTTPERSTLMSESAYLSEPSIEIISDFQSEKDWIKQSATGIQLYDHIDFINGSKSLQLVSDGNGSVIFSRSNIFSPALDLKDHVINAWIKVDDASKLKQLWFYFSNDGFKSSWYTCKIKTLNEIKSGEWFKIQMTLQDCTIIGIPDMSAINRAQIRIIDDATEQVTLHINEISTELKGYESKIP